MKMLRSTGATIAVAIGIITFATIIAGLSAVPAFLPYSGQVASCTVEDKDRTSGEDGGMRVYTDCGVFAVEDSLPRFLFNSADRYGDIKVGDTYDFEAVGFRIPFLSVFPNIISATRAS